MLNLAGGTWSVILFIFYFLKSHVSCLHRLSQTEEGLFVCSCCLSPIEKNTLFLVIFWLFCANQPEKYQFVILSQVPFFSSTEWGLISSSWRTQSNPCRMIEKSLNETWKTSPGRLNQFFHSVGMFSHHWRTFNWKYCGEAISWLIWKHVVFSCLLLSNQHLNHLRFNSICCQFF